MVFKYLCNLHPFAYNKISERMFFILIGVIGMVENKLKILEIVDKI